ncbi:hypothetical protein MUP77_08565 [Candidatus Bathyarchaeota archaeon]|nr:hypothetical protein [Candidatus Bathyarchaeota archaeon]
MKMTHEGSKADKLPVRQPPFTFKRYIRSSTCDSANKIVVFIMGSLRRQFPQYWRDHTFLSILDNIVLEFLLVGGIYLFHRNSTWENVVEAVKLTVLMRFVPVRKSGHNYSGNKIFIWNGTQYEKRQLKRRNGGKA